MIDYEKSAKLNGMDIEELKLWFKKYPRSTRRIIRVCDKCGGEKNIPFDGHSDLCLSCAKKLPKYRKAISEKMKQYNKDHPDIGLKHSEFMIRYYEDNPEVLAEKTKMLRDYWLDRDNRDAMSEIIRQYNKDHPESGNAHSVWMKQYWEDLKARKDQSKRLIEYFTDPKNRLLQSDRLIEFFRNHPEAREVARLKSIEQWSDPASREDASKRMIEYNKNNPEAVERRSAFSQGIPYEEWDGFSKGDWRDWDIAIYMNEPFPGCHRHHITETIVACIPSELHYHIKHNLRTGLNMGEINVLAIQFINGGL